MIPSCMVHDRTDVMKHRDKAPLRGSSTGLAIRLRAARFRGSFRVCNDRTIREQDGVLNVATHAREAQVIVVLGCAIHLRDGELAGALGARAREAAREYARML